MSLYDDATLILTPNEYDAGSIHSLKPVDGSGDLTVNRGSYANRVNSIGVLEYMSNNIARLDYSNGGCPKILQEPQRTNLLTYSEQFDNASWIKAGCSVTANDTIAPDGTATADKVVFSGTGTFLYQQSTTTGQCNHSIYIKGTAGQTISLDDTWSLDPANLFTLNGQWQRFDFNTTTASGQNQGLAISTFQSSTATTIWVWGAQLEAGPYATSYIPTDSATVTRLQDNIYRQNIDNLVGVNQGTLFIEYKALQNGGLANVVSLYNSDSPQQAIWINVGATANRIDGVLWDGSGSYVSTIYTVNQTDMNKIALIWGGGTMQIFINNVPGPIQSISGTFDGFDRIGLNYYNGTYPAYGFFNSLMVFDRPLTISEIAQL